MTFQVLTERATSISELKANPMKVIASANGLAIAVLNRNTPAFYCVPAAAYEAMVERLDDLELLQIMSERQHEKQIKITLDEL